jgi:hypothetical protein
VLSQTDNVYVRTAIGGTVTGVVGTGLILLNSGDSEQLPISPANGNQAALLPGASGVNKGLCRDAGNFGDGSGYW